MSPYQGVDGQVIEPGRPHAHIDLTTVPPDVDTVAVILMRDGKPVDGVRDSEAAALAVHSLIAGYGQLIEDVAPLVEQAALRLTETSWTADHQLAEQLRAWLARAFPSDSSARG